MKVDMKVDIIMTIKSQHTSAASFSAFSLASVSSMLSFSYKAALLSSTRMSLAASLMSSRITCLAVAAPVTGRTRRERSLLTTGLNSMSFTFELKKIFFFHNNCRHSCALRPMNRHMNLQFMQC